MAFDTSYTTSSVSVLIINEPFVRKKHPISWQCSFVLLKSSWLYCAFQWTHFRRDVTSRDFANCMTSTKTNRMCPRTDLKVILKFSRNSELLFSACGDVTSLLKWVYNMRTLKFRAQPTNAFFATVNQMFGGSLQLPTMLSELNLTI